MVRRMTLLVGSLIFAVTCAPIPSAAADNGNWDIGNIPGSPEATAKDIVLNYGQNYNINGWTIRPTADGTRFTNDGTGHGMLVSIENVYSF
jgi:hypothetical protein